MILYSKTFYLCIKYKHEIYIEPFCDIYRPRGLCIGKKKNHCSMIYSNLPSVFSNKQESSSKTSTPITHAKHPPTYTYMCAYILAYVHSCIFYLRQYFPSQCTSRFITNLLVNFKSQNHPILSMHFSHFQIYAMCNMTKKEDCRPGVCAGVCTCPYLVESVICLKCNFKFIVFKAVRFGNIHSSSFGVKIANCKNIHVG
jgi:hypothetical protein